ncbi:hypothetical protein AC578_2170 [Pseudocercospora eumusae]|uniref:Uncharacterized protein n=1 Tax=Pseudocercospora eumusae TaxID=321146 RepID=A0A139HHG4_9PEZI|nr:hypothetical protein AC578_2170 [Pseudocercospora eumusae]
MKIASTLLLLTGASVLVHGLNVGKRDGNGLLVGRQTAPAPCVEVEGPDKCPDDGPDRYDDGPPPPHREGDRPPPPREGDRPPAPAAAPATAGGACVDVEGPDDCPDRDDNWDDRQDDRGGDKDQDGVPNWQDTTDDTPRRADGSPLPPQCWPNPPPQREGDPPRPVCTDEDRNGPDRDRDWDGPGRGGRDGDRDYDGTPNWQDTTDDRPRRADGSPLPPQCWDSPPPLREGEPQRAVCTDEDRNGRAGRNTGSVPANTNGNTNASSDINPSGDVVGATDSYRQDSSVRQVDRNAGGRNSIPVLGGVAGLAIAFAAFM